ncbi:butyrate kinase [Christensenellaceae bacterium OttesenSCG-928-L17]|nr:butyrate kinase [Christensenellaceae bacterium OttesenSCG-928-L17]
MERLLVINPGSTSTKIAVFDDEKKVLAKTLRHEDAELARFSWVGDQVDYRKELIVGCLKEEGMDLNSLTCIMSRGGQIPPVPFGGYEIDQRMVDFMMGIREGAHVSNIGCVIAHSLAKDLNIPAYIYDPVTCDDLQPLARITGFADAPKKSRGHALNSHAMATHCAKNIMKRPIAECTFIVVHMGGGGSVWLFDKGRAIDMYSDDDAGFCPERCGRIQALELARLCYSGKFTYEQMCKRIRGNSGVRELLGTSDMRVVEERIEKGDEYAKLVYDAFIYSTAKSVGDLAVAVRGKVDRIVITGGIAFSKYVCEQMQSYLEWIAPVELLPGEFEMEALAEGGLRLLRGEEQPNPISY